MLMDNIQTIVFTKIIREMREEMKALPCNSWMWIARKKDVEYAINQIRKIDVIVKGFYCDKYYQVILSYPGYEDEVEFVPMLDEDQPTIFKTCKDQVKELASFYQCRFRIKKVN